MTHFRHRETISKKIELSFFLYARPRGQLLRRGLNMTPTDSIVTSCYVRIEFGDVLR